ncbi:hypothetical protein D3C72_2243370 [compost metagenome]
MDFSGLETQVSKLGDQVIQMQERLDLLVVINQEITSPGVLLEEHDPFLGVGRVGDHMSVKGNTFGMLAFHIFTIHVSHHATRALEHSIYSARCSAQFRSSPS